MESIAAIPFSDVQMCIRCTFRAASARATTATAQRGKHHVDQRGGEHNRGDADQAGFHSGLSELELVGTATRGGVLERPHMKANTPTATATLRMSVATWLKRVLMFPYIHTAGCGRRASRIHQTSHRRLRVKGAIDQRQHSVCRARRAATVPRCVPRACPERDLTDGCWRYRGVIRLGVPQACPNEPCRVTRPGVTRPDAQVGDATRQPCARQSAPIMSRLDGYSARLSITVVTVHTHTAATGQREARRAREGSPGRTALMLTGLALPLLLTGAGRKLLGGFVSWALRPELPRRPLRGRRVETPALPGGADKN